MTGSTAAAGRPSGRTVRRWTRAYARSRADAGLGELLGDVCVAALSIVVSGAMVLSLAAQFGADLATARPPTEHARVVFDLGWLGIAVGIAAIIGFIGLVARLGPVGVSAPEAAWWLPLPVDRRSLLRPAAARWATVAVVVGALSGVITALALSGAGDALLVTATGALGAALATAATLAVGLAQQRPRVHRWVRVAADGALAAIPVLAVATAVTRTAAPTVPAPALAAVAVAGVVGVVGLALPADRGLAHLRDASLRDRGAAATEALVATLSLDTRALGRALADRAEPAVRPSGALPWLARVPPRYGAAAALVTADALLLGRSPRHLVQLVVGACVPVLAVTLPEPSAWALVIALLGGAYLGALATADGARRAHEQPALDTLLPLGQRAVRRCRLVVPTVAMAGWAVAVFAVVAWRFGDPLTWLALGVLAAPVWGAAAVRAAYRPLPDFSGPLIVTPMGAVPPGLSSVVARGPDVALLGSVPVLVALAVGTVPAFLLVTQAVFSLGALAVVSRPGRRP